MAINDLYKKVLFAEVKRNQDKINLENLKLKSQSLLPQFKDYQGFSLENM